MAYNAFIDLDSLSDEARKELELFYKYLIFKYKNKREKKAGDKKTKGKTFLSSVELDTKKFKFNREEANER